MRSWSSSQDILSGPSESGLSRLRQNDYGAGRKRSPTPTSGATPGPGAKRKTEGGQPAAKRKRSATPPASQVHTTTTLTVPLLLYHCCSALVPLCTIVVLLYITAAFSQHWGHIYKPDPSHLAPCWSSESKSREDSTKAHIAASFS